MFKWKVRWHIINVQIGFMTGIALERAFLETSEISVTNSSRNKKETVKSVCIEYVYDSMEARRYRSRKTNPTEAWKCVEHY